MSGIADRVAALSGAQRRHLEARIEAMGLPLHEIPVLPRSEAGPAPLSFAQRRMWFLHQLTLGSTAYHLQWVIRLEGELDVAALERAAAELVRRHEILRTTYPMRDGEPVQVVDAGGRVPFLVHEAEREDLRELARRLNHQPFDLARGPLARIDLLRLDRARHVLLVTLHHIAADGWSLRVLVTELGALYEGFRAGRAVSLPSPPVQYADFAAWQRRWLVGRRLEGPLERWRRRLDGLPALRLDTDRPRPAVLSMRGGAVPLRLEPGLVDGLTALGRAAAATPFMAVLAGLQALLGRWSGQSDFAVGAPIANRVRPELEGLIGFFANTLALRADLAGDPTFAELLARVRETCLEAYGSQDVPFERLVEELRPARDRSRHPLFQVMLTVHEAPVGRLRLAGLEVTREELELDASRFDLEVVLEPDGEGGLRGRLHHSVDLFDRGTAEALAAALVRLLEDAVAHPDRRVSALELLDRRERRRLLRELAAGPVTPAPAATAHGLVAERAARAPDAPAVAAGDVRLTYAELMRHAGRLAHRLVALGAGPEARVAVRLGRGPRLPVALLAVLQAGAAYVPLDPGHPEERAAAMLADSGARILVTESALGGPPGGFAGVVLDLDRDAAAVAAGPAAPPAAGVGPDHLAYVIYTSGSTGVPKGVMVSHGALVNLLTAMAGELGLTSRDVMLATTTVGFDIAALELWAPLVVGGCLRLAPVAQSAGREELLREAGRSEITVMQGTPSTWRFLLERGWAPPAGRVLLCGGEAVPASLAARLVGAGSRLWSVYGPTETTVWSAAHRVSEGEEPVHLGLPIANTWLYVLDRHLRPVPTGVAGELCIGGSGLARGYQGRPGATAAAFVPDPCGDAPGGRLYRTGDLVRRAADGTLRFLGRIDDQVKIRGHRVEPGEVERVLERHPAVARAAVVVVADAHEDPALAAYVQPRVVPGDGAEDLGGALRTFLRARLPEAMVPAGFAVVDELPVTPNGKIDRLRLRSTGVVRSRPAYVAPRTPTEAACARVFADLLGLDRVGIDDDFFDAGGHSLLLARLAAELAAEFGVYVPLQTIFETATVANVAAIVERCRAGGEVGGDGPVILPPPLAATLDTALDKDISPAWDRGDEGGQP